MDTPPRLRACAAAVILGLLTAPARAQAPLPDGGVTNLPDVFLLPRIHESYLPLAARIQALCQAGQYAAAEGLCDQAVALVPWDAGAQYNLACARARNGRADAAFAALGRAVACGFRDREHLRQDPDLLALRDDPRFAAILKQAEDPSPPAFLRRQVCPLAVNKGVARVVPTNTAWEARTGTLATFFLPATNGAAAVVLGNGRAGELLRAWYKAGTAAGLAGDLYDNRDNDHSPLPGDQFPQLARIDYGSAAQAANVHWGLQTLLHFNRVTFGNSSTANTGGLFWRGHARFAYASPHKMLILYMQYVGNHLYIYPEHHDHDPLAEGGHGDVHPANTPYLIISQGSSGSDQPFLKAVACTLAAFRPDVKACLVRSGALMPTVQMILRRSNAGVTAPEDYLTGRAHPPVFDGGKLDVEKMVTLAHNLESNAVPPVIQLKVEEEDVGVPGRDYFTAGNREALFDTPCAVARIARAMTHTRRLVVSAAGSRDLNRRPLTFTWRVLRGDPARVAIRPLGPDGTRAELRVSYHAYGTTTAGVGLPSSRVDIGVFAHNGVHYSAPGFVTIYYPTRETRVYDTQDRILSCDYADPAARQRYEDPLLDLPKAWRDDYHYDARGRLLGWTRKRGTEPEAFTADGALVTAQDSLGRPTEARTVVYVARARARDEAPVLEQHPGYERLRYRYADGDDRVGRVVSRERSAPTLPAEPAADSLLP